MRGPLLARHQAMNSDHQDLCLLQSIKSPLILLSSGSGAALGWRLMLRERENTRTEMQPTSLSSQAKPALRTEEEVLFDGSLCENCFDPAGQIKAQVDQSLPF